MASELNSAEPTKPAKSGESRRSFLAKLGLGAAALALAAGPLRGLTSRNDSTARNQEFPGEDSIFHPAADPRQDPRRRMQG